MTTIKPKAMCGQIPVYCSHDEITDIMKVVPNPKNPNTHPSKQIKILSQIIEAQGWRKPITVSRRSGFVVSGHGRLEAALLLGAEQVPVDYQDYANEAEEWSDLVADNRIAELSSVDKDLLADILSDINATDFDLLLTGYEQYEIDHLIGEEEVAQVMNTLDYTFNDTSDIPNTPDALYAPSIPNTTDTDSFQRQKENTGEIDIDDFAEDTYRNQCPKCKFMW